MTYIQAIIIAIVEGLTEFLPISSTAHMKFTNPIIGVDGSSPFVDLFEVVIQLAAILSVLTIYWKRFIDFSRIDFYIKLIVAVIPALLFGAIFKKYIDAALSNLTFIAIVMLAGGFLLLFIDRIFASNEDYTEKPISYRSSFIIGCFQVLSIVFPGLSRSAATIIGGMTQKLSRKSAAEFSFFLAIPTMFAASAKKLLDTYQDHPEVLVTDNLTTLLIGAVVSYIVAILAIKFFISVLTQYGFKWFGVYRIILGAIILIAIASGVNLH
jgi:undecaprenyl-diphosphatase